MAPSIVRDAKLWVAGYDLSAAMSALAIEDAADVLDVTTLGNASKVRMGGLRQIKAQHEGFYEAGGGSVDEQFFAAVAANPGPVSIAVQTGAEGELAYMFAAMGMSYQPQGAIGEMLKVGVSLDGASDRLVRSTILHNAQKTATGNGTQFTLGAVSAVQRVFAALHVFQVAGTASPTLTVKVQSDTAGFASPLDVITFGAATAISGQWATPVVGPNTDTIWRVSYTISGTNPQFTFAVVVGIL